MSRENNTNLNREGKSYRGGIMASVHETMEGLSRIGLVDKQTMREFDAICLTPIPAMQPDDIKKLREREHVSQAVLAHVLNVSTSVVSQWERGKKRPAGAALKLLSLASAKGIEAIR